MHPHQVLWACWTYIGLSIQYVWEHNAGLSVANLSLIHYDGFRKSLAYFQNQSCQCQSQVLRICYRQMKGKLQTGLHSELKEQYVKPLAEWPNLLHFLLCMWSWLITNSDSCCDQNQRTPSNFDVAWEEVHTKNSPPFSFRLKKHWGQKYLGPIGWFHKHTILMMKLFKERKSSKNRMSPPLQKSHFSLWAQHFTISHS